MASFCMAALRLTKGAFGRMPRSQGRDEEKAPNTGTATISSTLGNVVTTPGGRRLLSRDDQLEMFRVMLGITHDPSMALESRAAENIGLYKRVVTLEQVSEDSYSVFNVLINACYFLQIIVAAALTALGAANANNKAITAFGAINTIIAGFLTYLKGSGLPGRLKYYGNEWKKIREYIEARERDLLHEGCTLDATEVVETIRRMYNNTKRDLEINTPDSYNSVAKAAGEADTIGGIHMPKSEDVEKKLHSVLEVVKKIENRFEKEVEDVHGAAHHAVEDFEKKWSFRDPGKSSGP